MASAGAVVDETTDMTLADFSRTLGIEAGEEPHLLALAEECMRAELPEGWSAERVRGWAAPVYRHIATGEVKKNHPLDAEYRRRVASLRRTLAECAAPNARRNSAPVNRPSRRIEHLESFEDDDYDDHDESGGNWPEMLSRAASPHPELATKGAPSSPPSSSASAASASTSAAETSSRSASPRRPLPMSPMSPKVVQIRPSTMRAPSSPPKGAADGATIRRGSEGSAPSARQVASSPPSLSSSSPSPRISASTVVPINSSMPVHPTSQSAAQRQPPATQSPYHQQEREEHEPYRGNNNREGMRFDAPYLTAGGRRGSDGRLLKSNTFVGRLPSHQRPSSSESGVNGEGGGSVGGGGGIKAPSRRATTMTHKRTGPVGGFLEERKLQDLDESPPTTSPALQLVPGDGPAELLPPEEGPPPPAVPLGERVAWLKRHHAPDRCYRFFIERRRDGLKSARYRAFTDGVTMDSPSFKGNGASSPHNGAAPHNSNFSKRSASSGGNSPSSAGATQKRPARGARRSSRNLMPKPGGQAIAHAGSGGGLRRAHQRRLHEDGLEEESWDEEKNGVGGEQGDDDDDDEYEDDNDDDDDDIDDDIDDGGDEQDDDDDDDRAEYKSEDRIGSPVGAFLTGQRQTLLWARRWRKSRNAQYIISVNEDDLTKAREERSEGYVAKLKSIQGDRMYSVLDTADEAGGNGTGGAFFGGGGGAFFGGGGRESSMRRELAVVIYTHERAAVGTINESKMEVAVPSVERVARRGSSASEGKAQPVRWVMAGPREKSSSSSSSSSSSFSSTTLDSMQTLQTGFSKLRYMGGENYLDAREITVLREPTTSPDEPGVESVKNFDLHLCMPGDRQHRAAAIAGAGGDEAAAAATNVSLMHMEKFSRDLFSVTYSYPFSFVQAFGIALSRFDTKQKA